MYKIINKSQESSVYHLEEEKNKKKRKKNEKEKEENDVEDRV